jgi:hypothetical protein
MAKRVGDDNYILEGCTMDNPFFLTVQGAKTVIWTGGILHYDRILLRPIPMNDIVKMGDWIISRIGPSDSTMIVMHGHMWCPSSIFPICDMVEIEDDAIGKDYEPPKQTWFKVI